MLRRHRGSSSLTEGNQRLLLLDELPRSAIRAAPCVDGRRAEWKNVSEHRRTSTFRLREEDQRGGRKQKLRAWFGVQSGLRRRPPVNRAHPASRTTALEMIPLLSIQRVSGFGIANHTLPPRRRSCFPLSLHCRFAESMKCHRLSFDGQASCKCLLVDPEVVLVEGAEDHLVTRPMPLQVLAYGSQRDRAGLVRGKAVGAGADAGEGDRASPLVSEDGQAVVVAVGQQGLAPLASSSL